jgi:hypothetical protein
MRPLTMILAASLVVPTVLILSPAVSLIVQFVMGCWLACASWVLMCSEHSRVYALGASLEGLVGFNVTTRFVPNIIPYQNRRVVLTSLPRLLRLLPLVYLSVTGMIVFMLARSIKHCSSAAPSPRKVGKRIFAVSPNVNGRSRAMVNGDSPIRSGANSEKESRSSPMSSRWPFAAPKGGPLEFVGESVFNVFSKHANAITLTSHESFHDS